MKTNKTDEILELINDDYMYLKAYLDTTIKNDYRILNYIFNHKSKEDLDIINNNIKNINKIPDWLVPLSKKTNLNNLIYISRTINPVFFKLLMSNYIRLTYHEEKAGFSKSSLTKNLAEVIYVLRSEKNIDELKQILNDCMLEQKIDDKTMKSYKVKLMEINIRN